ncbi:hypothetical protein QYE76_068475 [Lolium multiflorum]|uniref:BZIP domain-containing protein n=1 Tax=Lolium multiflorum TaxID=4521 RepID=A0AAD8SGT3_LOLMU|nr:hypothetical protein QYE76_068475 [Lolium multiflorum]
MPPSRRGMPLTEEERRRRRMASNRVSAQRSRMKRQQSAEYLALRVAQLAENNEAMRATTGVVLQHCELVEQANRVLAADARHLYTELERANSQLRLFGQFMRMPMDVPEIAAHLTQLYGGLQVPLPPPPSLSPSLLPPPSLSLPLQPPQSISLPLPPPSLSLPLQPPQSISLPLSTSLPPLPPSLSLPLPPTLPLSPPLLLSLEMEMQMLFQPEPESDQSDDVMDDAGSLPPRP